MRSRDAADAALERFDKPPLRVAVDGIELCGYFCHRSFFHELSRGSYEGFMRELFLGALEPGTTVVDGGAHAGLYTCLAARCLRGNGSVIAFEPDPQNFRALCHNVRVNRCLNVRTVEKALSDERGNTTFFQSVGTIGSSLIPRTEFPSRRLRIQTTTVDEELLLEPLSNLVVKLDLEGAEPLALEGMKRCLKEAERVSLFCEFNPNALRDGGYGPQDLIFALQSQDLSVLYIDERRKLLVPVAGLSPFPKGNLLCARGALAARANGPRDSVCA